MRNFSSSIGPVGEGLPPADLPGSNGHFLLKALAVSMPLQALATLPNYFLISLTLKRMGGGWITPPALSKARHFACDEVMSV